MATRRLTGLRRAAVGALFLTLAITAAGPAFAQPRPVLYDVAYRWSANLPSIVAYKREVSHILGRPFASRLTVVKWQSSYGLIYRRRGYFRSAAKTAREHSRILARHGLAPAAVVAVRPWSPILARGSRIAAAKPAKPIASPVVASVVAPVAAPAKAPVIAATPAPVVAPTPAPAAAQVSDPDIEGEIVSYIQELRRRGAIRRDERSAWSVYDLTSGTQLVSINEDAPFETASLVKPFIALAYFKEVSLGRRQYTPFARERMEAMIQESDNFAADYFLRKMGGPAAVSRLLKKNYGGILRDLRLVEYIPYNGRTYRNKASAHDYSRFLYALWKKQLPESDEIMRLMSLPKRNRLYTGANELPRNTQVYDKTGTTSRLCGDMGILVVEHDGRDYPYIVVGLIQKSRPARPYAQWMARRGDVIRQVSNIVYGAIAARHGFSPALSENIPSGASVVSDIAQSLASK